MQRFSMTGERFEDFSGMFANYPTLQKELSLLDKPASNGRNTQPLITRG